MLDRAPTACIAANGGQGAGCLKDALKQPTWVVIASASLAGSRWTVAGPGG